MSSESLVARSLLIGGVAASLSGCLGLGNRYNAQYDITCPATMAPEALHEELRRDADNIADRLGETVRSDPRIPTLAIVVHPTSPSSVWDTPQPIAIRLTALVDVAYSKESQSHLFIAVYRQYDPREDEAIVAARREVETILKASACPSWNVEVNKFSLVD